MTTTAKRVFGYVLLALLAYSMAAALGGVGSAAVLFVAGGLFFEGFLWMEARRARRRRAYPERRR